MTCDVYRPVVVHVWPEYAGPGSTCDCGAIHREIPDESTPVEADTWCPSRPADDASDETALPHMA